MKRLHASDTLFCKSRHVGQRARTPGSGYRNGTDLAALDQGLSGADVRDRRRDLSADQVLQLGRDALVGHVDHLHAELPVQDFTHHVGRRTVAVGAKVARIRLGLHRLDQLAQVLHGRVGVDVEDEGRRAKVGHRDRKSVV